MSKSVGYEEEGTFLDASAIAYNREKLNNVLDRLLNNSVQKFLRTEQWYRVAILNRNYIPVSCLVSINSFWDYNAPFSTLLSISSSDNMTNINVLNKAYQTGDIPIGHVRVVKENSNPYYRYLEIYYRGNTGGNNVSVQISGDKNVELISNWQNTTSTCTEIDRVSFTQL